MGWADDRVRFESADATALPFADDTFDAAVTIHAAMNISAKGAVYAEAKRVLKPAAYSRSTTSLRARAATLFFQSPGARSVDQPSRNTRANA
ncbi:MAG: class I SAM-dependent methyltransferase [Gammaproteobacteria bacterium]|nr:class I SAM-dependent methyltransferase [Gammaproteobacteria bacterium]